MKLLGMSGSLRSRSYNSALLEAARHELPVGVELEVAHLGELPLFNDDLLGDLPDPVRELTDRVRASDGLVLATPEYNGGVSGVLKNALDWLSVPYVSSSLRHKNVALVGASPGMLGTARAQTQLRNILTMCGCAVVTNPEVLVSHAHRNFDDDLRLVDDSAKALLGKVLTKLTWEIGDRHAEVSSRPGPTLARSAG